MAGCGWNVIECGCGPLGPFAVVAGLVGESGRVTGVGLNPAAVERLVTGATLGLGNVHSLVGDADNLDAAALGAPLGPACNRLFPVH